MQGKKFWNLDIVYVLYKFLPYSLGRGFFKIFLLPPRRVVYTQRTSSGHHHQLPLWLGIPRSLHLYGSENMNVPIPSEIILGFAGFLVSRKFFSFRKLPLPSGRLPGLLVPSLPTTWATKADADSYWNIRPKRRPYCKKNDYCQKTGLKYTAESPFSQAPSSGRPHVHFSSCRNCRYPMPEFIGLTILGTVPWTIFLVYAGSVLGHNWQKILDYKLEIALVCVVISIAVALGFHLYSKRKQKATKIPMKTYRNCILLFLFCLFFTAHFPDWFRFWTDEPVYGETAKEMLATGDWISPRIYGEFWYDKPPLFYWLEAISFSIFGVSTWAARLPFRPFRRADALLPLLSSRRFLGERAALRAGNPIV